MVNTNFLLKRKNFVQLLKLYKNNRKISQIRLNKINQEIAQYNLYELNLLASILFNKGQYSLSEKYLLLIIDKKKIPAEIYYNLALSLKFQKKKFSKYFDKYIKMKFKLNNKEVPFNKKGFKSYNLDFKKKDHLKLKKILKKKIDSNKIFGSKQNINSFYKCYNLDSKSEKILKSIFKKIFCNKTLNKDLLNFYQNNYSINWFNITRTLPCKNPVISFKWHCDYGIKNHLKILLYLNLDKKRTNKSNTIFLDSRDSKKIIDLGYDSKKISKRISDLNNFNNRISFKVHDNLIEKNNTIIFSPYNQIHKGVPPKKGYRDLLTIYLAEKRDITNFDYSIPLHSLQRHKFRILIPNI